MRDVRLIIGAVAAGGDIRHRSRTQRLRRTRIGQKAGNEAGKRIDQEVEHTKDAVDKAKENAARLLQEAGQKARDAAEQARQGARSIVEEAEHNPREVQETPKQ